MPTVIGLVLSSKIAPRAFGGVNSPDALCARHALAVAALAARDMPSMYVEQMGQPVSNSLEIWRTTGAQLGLALHLVCWEPAQGFTLQCTAPLIMMITHLAARAAWTLLLLPPWSVVAAANSPATTDATATRCVPAD